MGRWAKKAVRVQCLVAGLSAAIEVMGLEVAEPAMQAQVQVQKIRPPEHGCYVGVFPGWGELEDGVRAGPSRFYRVRSDSAASAGRVLSLEIVDDMASLTWEGSDSGSYTVQSTCDIASANWSDVPGTVWPISETQWTGDDLSATSLVEFERLSGKSVAVSPFSIFWGENYASRRQLDEMASYGAIPLLRLMPWGEPYWEPAYQPGYSLQKIIDGDFDPFLSDWADVIKDFANPLMVTFAVEMNGNWFPWSGVFQGGSTTSGFGDPQKADGPERYVAAYRHIVDLFRSKGVNNVTWLFQPDGYSFPEEAWNSIQAYYPGDEYMDWVGVSLYGTQYADENWSGFQVLMDPVYSKLTSLFPAKPLMLAEWGVGEFPSKGSKAAWYAEALSNLQSRYTRIKIAIVYHERWENDDSSWSDLRIDSPPEALTAYRNGISSDYFIGKIPLGTVSTESTLIGWKVTKTRR